MKFCKNCSASLEDNAVFCTECGASLADDNLSSGSLDSSSTFEGTIPEYSIDSSQSSSTGTDNTYTQQQYNAPQGSNPGTPWMIVNIVALFCCSGLFAIPGLILAILSMTSFNAGDIDESKKKAKTAMILTFCGIAVGLIVNILIVVAAVGASDSAYSY